MANPVIETGAYKNLSASGLVSTGSGQLIGIFCASSSSGTATVFDNTTGTNPLIVNTFNLTAGTFYRIPASFSTGCFVNIGATADITVFYNPVKP